MEPTTNMPTGGKNSKTIILVIVLVIVIIGIVMVMSKKTEAPLSQNTAGEYMSNSQLEASVNGAMDFTNEDSLGAIDQEFKQ